MTKDKPENNAKLIDLLDRVLDKGVVISGDIVVSVGGVDLLYLDIRILAGSLDTILRLQNSFAQSALPPQK